MRHRLLAATAVASILAANTVVAFAQEGDFTFRWSLFGRGGEEGPGGPVDPGGPGPGPGGGGGGGDVDDVIIDVDDEEYISVDPEQPEPPLSLVATTASLVPNANRVIHQCFQAAGGFQNYSFTMADMDAPWVEAFDLVLPADLGAATFPRSYLAANGTPIAPYLTAEGDRFTVSGSGTACLRVKIAENAPNYDRVQTYIYLDDYVDDALVGGSVAVGDLWSGMNYIEKPVSITPQCPGGCATDEPDPPPPLVVSTVGGFVDLNTLTYMGFGWGYTAGPGFNATPNRVAISGGLPPYNVQIIADAMQGASAEPFGDGCRISFHFYGFGVEFYPGENSAMYNATVRVEDAAGQIQNASISYSISGLSSGGYGGAGSGGYYDTVDPATDCGWVPPPPPDPLNFEAFIPVLEGYVGQDSTPFNLNGGVAPYTIEGLNLPAGITVDIANSGTLHFAAAGSWTGPDALVFRVTDSEGAQMEATIELTVLPLP